MPRHVRSMLIGPVLAFLVLSLAAGPRAGADVVSAATNGTDYIYKIIHMPDLDQRRVACDGVLGLANNGSMYCVPTSAVNMCVYAANHGFPALDPGPGNYQSAGLYTLATLNIAFMGVNMQTSPTDGTGGAAFDGLKQWVASAGLAGQLNVSSLWLNANYTPTFKKMSHLAIGGNLVSFAYGRWDVIGEFLGAPLIDRSGGHMVTLSRAAGSGPAQELWCRDPADVPNDCVQLPFTNRELDATNIIVADCPSFGCIRVMSALAYPSDDGRIRLIDSYLMIKPKAGYTFTDTGNQILTFIPFPFPDAPTINPQLIIDVPGIQDVVLDPDETGFYVIPTGPIGKPVDVLHLDALTEEMDVVAELATPRAMAIGRKLEIYVLEDDKVVCINPEAEEPITASAPLPGPVEAIIYTRHNDQVRLLSVENRMFYDYRIGLPAGAPPTMIPVPDEIPLGTQAAMAVNPFDGSFWIVSDASDSVWGIMSPVAGGATNVVEVVVPGAVAPTCVSFDDAGRMFVAAEGHVFEMIHPAGAGWIPAPDPQFADIEVGTKFITTCSFTNFDPADHPGPGWTSNIDPDALDPSGGNVPDCIADLDGDGLVGITDLLVLLAAWGDVETFEPADLHPLGGDGVVGITDLLALLEAWGPCPQ